MVVDGNRKRKNPSVQVDVAADNIADDDIADGSLTVHPSEAGFSIDDCDTGGANPSPVTDHCRLSPVGGQYNNRSVHAMSLLHRKKNEMI